MAKVFLIQVEVQCVGDESGARCSEVNRHPSAIAIKVKKVLFLALVRLL